MALVISGASLKGVTLTSPNRPPLPAVIAFNAANLTASKTNAQLGGRTDWSGTVNANYGVSITTSFSGGTTSPSGAYIGGTVGITATGLPFHSYYNSTAAVKPVPSNFNRSWTYRGGQNVVGTQAAIGTNNIGVWINGTIIRAPSAQNVIPSGKMSTLYTYMAAYQQGLKAGYNFKQDLAGGDTLTTSTYTFRDSTPVLSNNAWEKGIGYVSGTYGATGLPEVNCIPYLGGALNHPDGHSKILGIAADGYPIYGPSGYKDPNNSGSGTKLMVSGFGYDPFAVFNGVRSFTGSPPPINAQYPLGTFMQDWVFAGGGDLDIHNGRYCKTPDYPNGTYAYFITVDSTQSPVYPYIIGTTYYGTPANIG
jgi:hypothetical protein